MIAFPGASQRHRSTADPLLDAILRGELDPTDADAVDRAARRPADRRPLIVGGALTSAAISLVGVAYVAWRASRPGSRPRGPVGDRAMARPRAMPGRARDRARPASPPTRSTAAGARRGPA